PYTGRFIRDTKSNIKKVYKSDKIKPYKEGYMVNPETGRYVKLFANTFNRIFKNNNYIKNIIQTNKSLNNVIKTNTRQILAITKPIILEYENNKFREYLNRTKDIYKTQTEENRNKLLNLINKQNEENDMKWLIPDKQ